ncbi:MAG TPA: hypothetical protein VFA89_18240 [Terriglobales bacterium]|nr:hypothetical protein [Terriglobales bacterium]
MKNPYEILRAKEQEIERVKQEVEALKLVAPLLGEEDEERLVSSELKQRTLARMPS